MPGEPFFSVIIPVYNRAHSLRAALDSVRAQTCQDFEIIIVDDGSSDNPEAVVEAFGDPRIRFIAQENRGGGAARNAAIDAARGRFIAPLDSDDIFLPHHLQSMKTLLEGTEKTIGYARILVDRGRGRTFLKPPRALRAHEHMANYLLCERGFVPTITVVVPREIAKSVRYDENLAAAEDSDFAIRLFLAGCKFTMLESPGATWNDLHDSSRASSVVQVQRFGEWLEQLRPFIPARAYHGGRGWAYAKMIAKTDKKAALALYLKALQQGCYRPALGFVIFLQIFLGNLGYRLLADSAIGWLHVGLREPKNSAQSLSARFKQT